MLRWFAAVGLVAALVLSSVGVSAAADHPRLLLTKVSASTGTGEDLITVAPGRPGQRTLLPGRLGLRRGLSGGASWSPDGRLVAFVSKGYIWVVGADGRSARRLSATRGGSSPVFSPDGRTLAFAREKVVEIKGRAFPFESAAVWTVDLKTGMQHRLTSLRDGLEQFPSSFSPDGSTLLVTRYSLNRSFDFELVAIRFDGRTSSLLVGSGGWGQYSPDGARIVFMRQGKTWDLYTVDAKGDHQRRLTATSRVEEAEPSWDPSGQRIVYTRATFDDQGGIESAVPWEMNRDGSCAAPVFSEPSFWFFDPVFQPGPGREAGPLSC